MVDGISYIPSSALLTGIHKYSFKDDRAFAVVDPQGECPRLYADASELGFYFNDTRHLGVWEMTFNGQAPISLSQELRFGGNTVVFSMTNRDFPVLGGGGGGTGRIPRDTFLIRRILTLWRDTLYETIEIKNFDIQPHEIQVEQWCGGRFDDVFEVRGFPREKRGRMLTPEDELTESKWRTTVFSYEGLDGKTRSTHVQRLFPAEKIRVSPTLAGHFARVSVRGKGTAFLKTIVSFDQPSDYVFHGRGFDQISTAEKMTLLHGENESTLHFAPLKIESDNAILNRAIINAQTDIYMLLTDEVAGEPYPYAGIPWFSAPFGRDGIITAYQLLPWSSKLARGVLEYVFKTLGDKFDPFTDEQPGKVFHEMRRGEMSNAREVPFIPYYGSVDATPLALTLLHEYIRWTLDIDSLRRWWPQARKALEWVRAFTFKGAFVSYAKQSPTGLVNQGWKDSNDSVMHADGRLATPPIQLCEVQGYAYRALMSMSSLARFLGEAELAQSWRREALEFKALFSERFWDASGSFVHLAMDGSGTPCAVRSSNMGHCLWAEILDAEQAASISDYLLSDSMFTGYGIRTLSKTEIAYNPLSYHNGSVWPHDNSLIMEGLRNYGMIRHLETLALGVMGVLETSADFRLPELFCGFKKRQNAPPVPYEVACKPQAWAAGSIFLMLKSMLGMSIDLDQNHLVFNSPLLTSQINTLEIRNLQGRDWEIDLVLRRSRTGTVVDVLRKHGNVRVLTVK